nr:hypothetical protein Iba_chr01cCG5650 [Ipomoea batatas]
MAHQRREYSIYINSYLGPDSITADIEVSVLYSGGGEAPDEVPSSLIGSNTGQRPSSIWTTFVMEADWEGIFKISSYARIQKRCQQERLSIPFPVPSPFPLGKEKSLHPHFMREVEFPVKSYGFWLYLFGKITEGECIQMSPFLLEKWVEME